MDQLPDEILVEVLRHLRTFDCPTYRRSLDEEKVFPDHIEHSRSLQCRIVYSNTLASLCRTSKRFHAFAEPYLYETYVKTSNRFVPADVVLQAPLSITPNKGLRRFLRTIIDRPSLALQVRHIVLLDWETDHSALANGFYFNSLDEATAGAFCRAASLAMDDFTEIQSEWAEGLRLGNEDAEIALLVALTINVTSLELRIPPYLRTTLHHEDHHIFMLEVLRHVTSTSNIGRLGTHQPLHKLENLLVWPAPRVRNPRNDAIHLFANFFLLPKLTSFAALGVREEYAWRDNAATNWPPPKPLYRLKTLGFHEITADGEFVHAIANTCEDLDCFEFTEKGNNLETLRSGNPEHAYSLCAGLLCHRLTLRALTLRVRDRLYSGSEASILTLLQSFTALRALTIDEYTMLRPSELTLLNPAPERELADHLPEKIVTLHICNTTERILPQLQRLAATHSSRSLALQHLLVEQIERTNPENTQGLLRNDITTGTSIRRDVACIPETFRKAGVYFEWKSNLQIDQAAPSAAYSFDTEIHQT